MDRYSCLGIASIIAIALARLPAQGSAPQWIEHPDVQVVTRAGCTYDTDRNVAVVFGGRVSNIRTTWTDATWEWDGTKWLRHEPEHGPQASEWNRLAYDSTRKRVVLFDWGFGETWEWDSIDWEQKTPTESPAVGPVAPAMTFDEARGMTVLFH